MTIKDRGLSLVKLAHESSVPCIVAVKDGSNNIVDAIGPPFDLATLLTNAVHHCCNAMPQEVKAGFCDALLIGITDAIAMAKSAPPRRTP